MHWKLKVVASLVFTVQCLSHLCTQNKKTRNVTRLYIAPAQAPTLKVVTFPAFQFSSIFWSRAVMIFILWTSAVQSGFVHKVGGRDDVTWLLGESHFSQISHSRSVPEHPWTVSVVVSLSGGRHCDVRIWLWNRRYIMHTLTMQAEPVFESLEPNPIYSSPGGWGIPMCESFERV